MLLEPLLQLGQALELLFFDLAGGDLGPHLDDPGDILHGQLGGTLGVQCRQFILQPHLLAAQLGDAGVVGVPVGIGGVLRLLLHQGVPLKADVLQILLHLHAAVDVRVMEVQIGAGLVNEVDGLVRQESVGDIALAEEHGLTQHALGNGHAVVGLIVVGDALEDLQCILDVGLVDGDRLETPLQSGILLDVLAVLVEGGGADHLDLTPAQGGLEDVGGVHAALGIAGAHDVVDLVDDQDHVAGLADLFNQPLHAALELTAELGTGHQGRQIQQIDLLLAQLEGHLAGHDPLGQPLGNGGLAHAGLTDEAGIVFLAAAQDLYHPLDLLLTANNGVQLVLTGPLTQIDAVIVQKFMLFFGFFLFFSVFSPACGTTLLPLRGRTAVEQPVQKREGGRLADLLVLIRLVGVGQVFHLLGAAKGLHHLGVEIFQVLRRDAHTLHHVLHLGQAQLGGALEAQALVDHLVLLVHAGDEHHGHILLALGTNRRLHGFSSKSLGMLTGK